MDEYEAYLRERIKWYTNWCLEDAAKIGYPGKIKFAEQSMRYSLECYEETLEEYLKFRTKRDEHYQLLLQDERTQDIIRELQVQAPATAPDKPLSVTEAQGYISEIEDIPVARSLYDDDEGEGE